METGKLDLAIGAITITEAREKLFDFSHSYFHTGLGIMIPTSSSYSLSALIYAFFSRDRLITIGLFVLLLLFAAHLIWLAERRQPQSFDSSYRRGIFQGIYWAVVTAATVGYGDFTPKSPIGKLISIFIIIISLPLMAVFVASFSSDITLHELRSFVDVSYDLAGKKVGVVSGSTSDEYLQQVNICILKRTKNLHELFKKFEQGSFDAIVHDAPTLHYYASTIGFGKIKVASTLFNKQNYAIMYQDNSELKEPVDIIMLKLSENGHLDALYTKWFGEFGRDAIGEPSHGPSHK